MTVKIIEKIVYFMLDLHIHTRYSADAQGEPADYIARACKIGLSGISITEHQNISSTRQASQLAREAGLNYISGVEFCAPYKQGGFQTDLHILVYGFDTEDEYIQKYLQSVRRQEDEYIGILFDGLKKLNVDITRNRVFDAIAKYGWSRQEADSIYIRRLMRELGYARDKPESSRLEQSAIAAEGYDEMSQYPDMDFLFEQMRLARTVCVLAHPFYYTSSLSVIETCIDELVRRYGISGIELWHPSNPKENRGWLTEIANRYSLITTGGSDAHRVEQLGAEGVSEDLFLKKGLFYNVCITNDKIR